MSTLNKNQKISRRDMLKMTGAALAGAALVGCAQQAATEAPLEEQPAEEPVTEVTGTVTVMHQRNELSEDQEAQFEADNPGITMEFVDGTDLTRFYAMYAAGSPPDLVRIQAPSVPNMLARKLLLDLTPFFTTSTVLKPDDLMPANNYYKANSPLEIGSGSIYGMVKDFSPDFTVYAYKPLFEQNGLPVPDDTKAYTYAEIFEMGRKLISFEGDRQLTIGYNYEQAWIDRIWMNCLAELGKNLYSEGYEKIILTGDEDAKALAKYYHDLAVEKIASSSLNPSPNGWFGTDYTAGVLAMAQYGFWFSAMAESDVTKGQAMLLPGPTWSGVRRDPTMTATGMVASQATKVPDATWKVFEWYNGEQPAIDRAKSGWGVPGLKSMLELIPQETDFQKQANKVLQGELALETTPLQFNPFIGEAVVSTSWSKNLDQALRGEITFDTMVANIEAEVNQAIKDGISTMLG